MDDLLVLMGKGKTKKWLVGKGASALQSGGCKKKKLCHAWGAPMFFPR